MTSWTLTPRLLLAAAVLALPLTSAGCGREACFTWSEQEGTCPAQSEALRFFSNPSCPGKITSVESEGTNELNGTLCCYQVTAREQSDESLCQGFGGANSSSVVGQGVGGSSSFAATGQGGFGAASSTGEGGSTSCSHCGDVLAIVQPKPICPEFAGLFKAFVNCACSGACAAECADNFCVSNPTTMACFTCLEDAAGCQMEFSACANDI